MMKYLLRVGAEYISLVIEKYVYKSLIKPMEGCFSLVEDYPLAVEQPFLIDLVEDGVDIERVVLHLFLVLVGQFLLRSLMPEYRVIRNQSKIKPIVAQ
jgi:hypothetical protein